MTRMYPAMINRTMYTTDIGRWVDVFFIDIVYRPALKSSSLLYYLPKRLLFLLKTRTVTTSERYKNKHY